MEARTSDTARASATPPARATDDPKSRVALRLTLWAVIGAVLLAAYAMFLGDHELLDRIMRLIEYVVVFFCGWAGGRPKAP